MTWVGADVCLGFCPLSSSGKLAWTSSHGVQEGRSRICETPQSEGSELAQSHCNFILLVKTSHNSSLDLRDGEADSFAC